LWSEKDDEILLNGVYESHEYQTLLKEKDDTRVKRRLKFYLRE